VKMGIISDKKRRLERMRALRFFIAIPNVP